MTSARFIVMNTSKNCNYSESLLWNQNSTGKNLQRFLMASVGNHPCCLEVVAYSSCSVWYCTALMLPCSPWRVALHAALLLPAGLSSSHLWTNTHTSSEILFANFLNRFQIVKHLINSVVLMRLPAIVKQWSHFFFMWNHQVPPNSFAWMTLHLHINNQLIDIEKDHPEFKSKILHKVKKKSVISIFISTKWPIRKYAIKRDQQRLLQVLTH